MANFGIKSVSYVPICSSEEIQIEIKKPTGNETVRKMWDKLDNEEQGFINVMIDRDNRQNEEIERLNNIIKEAINYTTKQMKKYEGYDRDFEIVLSNIVVMLGSDKE